jgi:hypothetical protein
MGRLYDTLEKRGILDNTMIVFTNDNGAITGEHYLLGKQKPYEPVSSMPLFIRYPAWFDTSASTCYDDFTMTIDLVPTFLSLANVKYKPYHFQGVPLTQTIFKHHGRNSVYFETIKDGLEGNKSQIGVKDAPSWRAVRTMQYKYVRYRCDSLTEELFDMDNDSLEDYNLARNMAYANVLNDMRLLLDSLRFATHDTLSRDTVYGPCYLKSINGNRVGDSGLPFEVLISPQPADDFVRINFVTGESESKQVAHLELYNEVGIKIETLEITPQTGFSVTMDVSHLPKGLYFLKAKFAGNSRTVPLVLE